MNKLFKKLCEDKKGFTLAELLVVVAIIGILIAISIPVFSAQLGKARKATNQANLRAAKAAAVAEYLTTEVKSNKSEETTYHYNIEEGTVSTVDDPDSLASLVSVEIDEASSTDSYSDIYVKIKSAGDGVINNASVTLHIKTANK